MKLNNLICFVLLKIVALVLFHTHSHSTASLVVTPLWNTNTDRLCTVTDVSSPTSGDSSGGKIVSGSTNLTCGVSVMTSQGTRVSLQTRVGHIQRGTDYVYVERLDASICTNRYVFLEGIADPWTCPAVFESKNLTVSVQADVPLLINETASTRDDFQCPESKGPDGKVDNSDNIDMPDNCSRVQGYDYIQSCIQRKNRDDTFITSFKSFVLYTYTYYYNLYFWFTDIFCDLACPLHCTTILGDRNVTFNCDDDKVPHHGRVVRIIYPYNVSHLNFTLNKINRITPDAFNSIGPLVLYLDMGWNELTTLNANVFQNLANLKGLGMTGCGIEEIGVGLFQHLTNLTELWLNKNELRTIDVGAFQGLEHLEILNLRSNKLTHMQPFAFRGLVSLQELILYDNALFALENDAFMGLNSLTMLNLRLNSISNLTAHSFRGLGHLKMLRLDENMLESLEVGQFIYLVNLTELNLGINRIQTLHAGVFEGLNKLISLFLGENHLTTIEAGTFSGLHTLTGLHLYKNRLVSLDRNVFQGLSQLNALSLHENMFQTLETNLFKGLNKLSVLIFEKNRLHTLPAGIFHGLNTSVYLLMTKNNLSVLNESLFDGITNIFLLHLSFNRLETIHAHLINTQKNLITLQLNDNRLTTLDKDIFHGLNSLRDLTLYNNRLKAVDVSLFKGLTSLDRVYLFGNMLETLDVNLFNGLSKLRWILLNNNSLTNLTVGIFNQSKMSTFQRLSVASNRLVLIQKGLFDGLHAMIQLDLNDNRLATIEVGAFDGLENLNILILRDNNLKELSLKLFSPLARLTSLDLSNNDLRRLPALEQLQKLVSLNIKGNRLNRIEGNTFDELPFHTSVSVDQPEICKCYIQNNTCTASNPLSDYLTCSRLLTNRPLLTFMWLFGCCAIIGNAMVLYLRIVEKEQNKVQSLLLGHLAMSDLLMGIYMIIMASADVFYKEFFPMSAELWRTGTLCKIAGALCITSSEASVLFVTIISIDRFIGIKYPYGTRKLRVKSTWVTALFMWVFASTVGIIPSILTGRNPDFYDNSHVCIGLPLVRKATYGTRERTDKGLDQFGNEKVESVSTIVTEGENPGLFFSVALFLGFNLLCFLIIFLAYVEIIRTVIKTAKEASRKIEMRQELKMTGKVAIIVATDFCCWSPIIIMGILVQSGVVSISTDVFAWAVTFILPINSAINPFLYTLADFIAKQK